MKQHTITLLLAISMLAPLSLPSCVKSRSAPKKGLYDDTAERQEQQQENQVEIEELAATYEVQSQAWLCKRREDVRVTNRPVTDKNRDHFDYRIAKGKLIDLPPGTRLKRRSGTLTYPQAGNRKYIRVEVMGGEYHEERGLVALDSVVRVK